jgi:hypothetical protein
MGFRSGLYGGRKSKANWGACWLCHQMEFGAMVLGVVTDGHDSSSAHGASLPEYFKQRPEGLPVEPFGVTAKWELTVPQTYGGKMADALARRVMIYDIRLDPWSPAEPTCGIAILHQRIPWFIVVI